MATLRPNSATTIDTAGQLAQHYRDYLRVLNSGNHHFLKQYVAHEAVHNGRQMSRAEYAELIPPGAMFFTDSVLADVGQRSVAARLSIEYTGLPVGATSGEPKLQRVMEHVFYTYDDKWKIERVWSMVQHA